MGGDHSLQARQAAIEAMYVCKKKIKDAVKYYKEKLAAQVSGPTTHVHEFINRWWNHFIEEGNLDNDDGKGNKPVLPDKVAEECAVQFKAGYVLTVRKFTTKPAALIQEMVEVQEHRWFTSLHEGIEECAYLRAVLDKYDVTPQTLLRRMHAVDPDLVKRRLDCKYELTKEQKEERVKVALQLLDRWRADPYFFKRVVWIDECCFWLTSLSATNVRVWADAHDQDVRAVLGCRHLRDDVMIRVCFVCAVNALTGPLYIDFVTGTHDLRRLHVNHPGDYKVSGWEGNTTIAPAAAVGSSTCALHTCAM